MKGRDLVMAAHRWDVGKELLLLDTTLEAGMKTGEAALMYSFQALVS
jgi:hypothetical protein